MELLPLPIRRRVELTVAGGSLFSESGYERELRGRARDARLPVRFLGHVNDVSELLATHDVLVHASTRPEPFGQVVAQGMCAGLATIATDGGGPAELITSGETGSWCHPAMKVRSPPSSIVLPLSRA
uniref:Glycos_transf_1 n=1 Tax=uncultured Paenibacillus sp. TaxID=227322 RepID=A0A060C8W6_9BACL|nr:Glycos_transf_1 [uncultured Paenibacillus sp.]